MKQETGSHGSHNQESVISSQSSEFQSRVGDRRATSARRCAL